MLSAMLCGPRVLAVHLGDIDLLGLLRLVRMLVAAIDVKIAHLPAAQRSARDHALDGFFQDAPGETALEDFARGAFLDMTDVAGVLVIDLVFTLPSGQHRMRGIDD